MRRHLGYVAPLRQEGLHRAVVLGVHVDPAIQCFESLFALVLVRIAHSEREPCVFHRRIQLQRLVQRSDRLRLALILLLPQPQMVPLARVRGVRLHGRFMLKHRVEHRRRRMVRMVLRHVSGPWIRIVEAVPRRFKGERLMRTALHRRPHAIRLSVKRVPFALELGPLGILRPTHPVACWTLPCPADKVLVPGKAMPVLLPLRRRTRHLGA